MKKLLLGLILSLVAGISQATTINVKTYGDYSANPYANTVTVLASSAASIVDPSVSGPQVVYWFNLGEFPGGPSNQDTSLEQIIVTARSSSSVTIGLNAYKTLTVVRATNPKSHRFNQTNAIQFTLAIPTQTPTNTPTNTPTATPTNSPTNTPTTTPTITPTSTPTNTPTVTPTPTPNILSGSIGLANPQTPTAISNALFSATTHMVVTEKASNSPGIIADTFAVTCVSGACSVVGSATTATTVFWVAQP